MVLKKKPKRLVPENIHTSRTEGIGNSWRGEGGSQRPKNISKGIKLDWNFQRGGGGGGLRKTSLQWGGMDNFWNHTTLILNVVMTGSQLRRAPGKNIPWSSYLLFGGMFFN